MRKPENAEEKFVRMTQTPVPVLVIQLAVPAIVSMLITSIYNMADTFFVGQLNDNAATGGVGVCFSVMAIIQALGFTFGQGSGNHIAKALGEKNQDRAEEVAATGLLTGMAVAAILAILGELFLRPLVFLLGATETIAPHAEDYLFYILIGMPFMVGTFIMNTQLRYEGSAYYAMFGMATGGILNVILDPIFIFGLSMGVGGSAFATIISQFVSFCILLFQSQRGGNVHLRIKRFSCEANMHQNIILTGLPSMFRQGLSSIAMILLNTVAKGYGDVAVAAMTVVNRIVMFTVSIILGLGQGFQPLSSFNNGAKRYDRVYEAFWFCVKLAVIALAFASVGGNIFAPQLISLFRDDPEVIEIGARALRIQFITLPLMAWIVLISMLMQTTGQSTRASILALSRQGMFFVPCILVLPAQVGILGVQISQPVSDTCTFIFAILLSIGVLKELKGKAKGISKRLDDRSDIPSEN